MTAAQPWQAAGGPQPGLKAAKLIVAFLKSEGGGGHQGNLTQRQGEETLGPRMWAWGSWKKIVSILMSFLV